MAKALELSGNVSSLTYSLRSVRTLRLALGLIALLGATLFFLGTSWDIQWHSFIGRDRTLIPPHIVMLCGVALSGIAALSAILAETLWTRHNPVLADKNISFADAFHGPLGAYIAGFGALAAGVAFPLDSYWHALYGIDVAIWAPFHIMFITGMAIVAFGSIYMLTSAAHLAESEMAQKARRAGYIGASMAFAVVLSIFTFLLFDAFGHKATFDFGFMQVNMFTMLAALLGTWLFVAAAYTLPWRWSATFVAAISLLLVAIVFFYVPPATNLLLQAEHLSYKDNGPHIVVVALEWPAFFIVGAIIIDCLVSWARRKDWSSTKMILIVAACSLVAFLPIPLASPTYPLRFLDGNLGGFTVALLVGFAGGCVGTWLGQNIGRSLRTLER